MANRWKRQGASLIAIMSPELRARAHYATDKATSRALRNTRQTIRAVGLGRLANAVGSYSSTTQKDTNANAAYGAVFARGKAEGRGNQALLAYSEGATIVPGGGRKWLAFATNAIPKRVGRYKMTPARYRTSGLVQTLGKLQFVRGKNPKVAYLVARDVTVSRKTGRARGFVGRTPRGSDRKKTVIAFILIRYTSRAARFSQDAIMKDAQASIPGFAAQYRATRG